jgi:hypothetical protein
MDMDPEAVKLLINKAMGNSSIYLSGVAIIRQTHLIRINHLF